MQLTDGKIDLYSGNDDQVVPILSLGGSGVISVLSNVAPRETHDMVQKFLDGDVAGSREIQLRSTAAHRCAVLRSKPDSGKSSAEPDGQRGWTASSAADRDGAAEPGAPGKGYERFWNQTGLKLRITRR